VEDIETHFVCFNYGAPPVRCILIFISAASRYIGSRSVRAQKRISMKYLLAVLLSCILLSNQVYTNGLFIRGQIGRSFHLTHETQVNDYIPAEFQASIQTIGLGQYYDNGNEYNFGLGYSTSTVNQSNLYLSFFLSYATHSITSKSISVDEVFGNTLDYSSLCFTAGLGMSLGPTEMSPQVTLNCGPLINYVKGNSNLDNYRIVFDYEPSIYFRLSLNVNIPVITKSQGISISGSYDFGSIQRGKVNYYQDSFWIARAKPTGDLNVSDNRITITIGFFANIF